MRVSRVQRDVQVVWQWRVTWTTSAGRYERAAANGDVSRDGGRRAVTSVVGHGDIQVSMERLTGNDDLEFSSGNGTIELILPADFSADVEASTGNGRIVTDSYSDYRPHSPPRLRGKIGDGGRRLRMSTGNGAMEIRKR